MFSEEMQAHEQQLKQMDIELEQMKEQHDLDVIAAKGEQDRMTVELEGQIKENIELIRADANMISYNAEVGQNQQQAGIDRLNEARMENDRERLRLDREQQRIDTLLKIRDQNLKDKQIDTQYRIALANKNKYDKGTKK